MVHGFHRQGLGFEKSNNHLDTKKNKKTTDSLSNMDILSQATIKVVCVTLSTMKPRAIPEALREELKSAN